jgi:hypothetical protein
MKSKEQIARVLLGSAAFLLMACGSDDTDSPQYPEDVETPVEDNRMVVNILTRAEDDDVRGNGPSVGLYMVNYVNGQHSPLTADGNYVNNLPMNYSDGTWVPSAPIYWQDTNINADFYAYAPFMEQVEDATSMVFRVETDQTSEEGFQKSDLLWGTAQGLSPSGSGVSLTLNHQLSRLTIVVTPGAGFSEGELKTGGLTVTIGGSKTMGTVDLQSGTVTAKDEVVDVKCRDNGDLTFTAILLPQQISFTNLVSVDWNGNVYTLQNSFRLDAKKQYRLTIRLNKTQGGLDIGISGWDIIDEDFGGTVG